MWKGAWIGGIRLAGGFAQPAHTSLANAYERTRALALGATLLPVGLATHEMMHLAVFALLGHQATLETASWHLRLVDLRLFTVHAAPSAPVPLAVQALDNALGPLVAAALLGLVWSLLRDPAARAAVVANLLVQGFFAVIETAYPLLEDGAGVDADFLLVPELSYGATRLILVGVTVLWHRLPGADIIGSKR